MSISFFHSFEVGQFASEFCRQTTTNRTLGQSLQPVVVIDTGFGLDAEFPGPNLLARIFWQCAAVDGFEGLDSPIMVTDFCGYLSSSFGLA
jgi:hypothetical protein